MPVRDREWRRCGVARWFWTLAAMATLGSPLLSCWVASGAEEEGKGVEVLIPKGSVWRYWDGPPESVPADWMQREFDDAAWKEGPAPLGYGDGDEATVIASGPEAGLRSRQAFFRLEFEVPNSRRYATLHLEMQVDDGAVIYLNGKDVARARFPWDEVLPPVNEQVENDYGRATADAEALVAGRNVLAVELHQAIAPILDASFDLELSGAFPFSWKLDQHSPRVDVQSFSGTQMAATNRWLAIANPIAGRGEVAVFHKSPETNRWIQKQTLTDPQPSDAEAFGYALDITDQFLAIGALRERQLSGHPFVGRNGAVLMYRFDDASGRWMLAQRFAPATLPRTTKPEDLESGFCHALALSGSTLAVLANNLLGTHRGIHVFQRENAVWSETGFIPLDRQPTDMDLWGDLLALGFPDATVRGMENAGIVALYRRDSSGNWSRLPDLTEPVVESGAQFGSSVKLDGLRMIVGARLGAGWARGFSFCEPGLFGGWRVVQTVSRDWSRWSAHNFDAPISGHLAAIPSQGAAHLGPSIVDLFRWNEDGRMWRLCERIQYPRQSNGFFPYPEGPMEFAGGDLLVRTREFQEYEDVTTAVIPLFEPVEILSQPVTEAVTEKPYRYALTGSAGDGVTPRHVLRRGPHWLQLSEEGESRHVLSGTPPASAAGEHDVFLEAWSPDGLVSVQTFVLRVNRAGSPPVILRAPEKTRVLTGRTAALGVEAVGEGDLLFRWFRNGTLLPGETGDRLEFAAALPSESGGYHVEVSNENGVAKSEPAVLEVMSVEAPERTFLVPGDFATLTEALEEARNGPLTILLQAGYHSGPFTLHHATVRLHGLDGAERTVLEFAGFHGDEIADGSILEGVTLRTLGSLRLGNNVIIRDCILQNNHGSGLFVILGSDVVIAGNLFRNNRLRVLLSIAQDTSAMIVNNIVLGGADEAVLRVYSGGSLIVAHNTFVDCPELVDSRYHLGWTLPQPGDHFANNIVAHFTTPLSASARQLASRPHVEGNLFWSTDSAIEEITTPDFFARNNRVSDPMFVDIVNANFELQAGSPAIESGFATVSVRHDARGRTRPRGIRSDSGAFEFQTGQEGPALTLHPSGVLWHEFDDVDQRELNLTITGPEGSAVEWELRQAPDWIRASPRRGRTPDRVNLQFDWDVAGPPKEATGVMVFGSGAFEVAVTVQYVHDDFQLQELLPNLVDGWVYARISGRFFRIDPRTGLLDGRPVDPRQSHGPAAIHPATGRIAWWPSSPAPPGLLVLDAHGEGFTGGVYSPQSQLMEQTCWIGEDYLLTADHHMHVDLSVCQVGMSARLRFAEMTSMRGLYGVESDPATGRFWIASSTFSDTSPSVLSLSALQWMDGTIRHLNTFVDETSPRLTAEGAIHYDTVEERVHWNGHVFDPDVHPIGTTGVIYQEMVPGSGVGLDAFGAVSLSTGERLVDWQVEAQHIAAMNRGPGVLLHSAEGLPLRLFPFEAATAALEEHEWGTGPEFRMGFARADQPDWTCVVFSVEEEGRYRVQRSTDGRRWIGVTPDETLPAGWHSRWVRNVAQSGTTPTLFRVVKFADE